MHIDLIESPWKSVLVDGSVRELVPLGLGYIASSLIELTGHIPRILSPKIEQVDGNLEKWITDNLILHSDIVGISATTDTFLSALKIAESIKSLNNEVTIVLGGFHATVVGGKKILDEWHNLFDYVIEGEGDYSFPALVKSIENKEGLESISGLSWIDNNGVNRNAKQLIGNLDQILLPKRELLKHPVNYSLHNYGLDVTIVTSRGCSHTCSFCSIASFYDRKWRFRSVENVLHEVEGLIELYGERFFLHFVDDNFFVNPERATKIICEIHKKWPNIVFSFATRSDQLLRGLKFLQVLKENNCVSIEIGIENGSQSVLDRYGKGVSVNTNKEAIMLLREIGMDGGIDYILFDYKTTLNELEENIQFFKETSLWGNFPSLVYSSLVLYPGTPSADKWLENDKNFIYYDRPTFCKFENEVVGKIFEFMSFFAKKRELIFELLNIVAERKKSEKSKKITPEGLMAAQLKMMPYKLLDKLIKLANDNWSDVKASKIYNLIIEELDEINEKLHKEGLKLEDQK